MAIGLRSRMVISMGNPSASARTEEFGSAVTRLPPFLTWLQLYRTFSVSSPIRSMGKSFASIDCARASTDGAKSSEEAYRRMACFRQ